MIARTRIFQDPPTSCQNLAAVPSRVIVTPGFPGDDDQAGRSFWRRGTEMAPLTGVLHRVRARQDGAAIKHLRHELDFLPVEFSVQRGSNEENPAPRSRRAVASEASSICVTVKERENKV